MKIPPNIRLLIAVHEASHATAMIAQGNRIKYVTIIPENGMLGHVAPVAGARGDGLVSILAGDIGVELCQPGGGELIESVKKRNATPAELEQARTVHSDAALAYAIASLQRPVDQILTPITDAELHDAYVAAGAKAKEILVANMNAMFAIADALFKHGRVGGDLAARLFLSHALAPLKQNNFFEPIGMESIGAL